MEPEQINEARLITEASKRYHTDATFRALVERGAQCAVAKLPDGFRKSVDHEIIDIIRETARISAAVALLMKET